MRCSAGLRTAPTWRAGRSGSPSAVATCERFAGGRQFAGDALVVRQLDGQRLVRPDALDGSPGHADFTEEFALEGELAAVLFDDAAGDGVAVLQDDLIGMQDEGRAGAGAAVVG